MMRLSYEAGWKDDDISFLRGLKNLRGVSLFSPLVRDASVLAELTDLRLVKMVCDLRVPVDFATLRKLEVVKLKWSKELDSVFVCEWVTYLSMMSYPAGDLSRLKGMLGLRRLALTSRRLSSLAGLESLARLESLDLLDCRMLDTLDGVMRCTGIKKLEVESCRRLHSIEPIANLVNLRHLTLDNCGNLNSLEPLGQCRELESLSFVGTRIMDGRLSSLERLPRLRDVFFTPYRHYDRSRQELLDRLERGS